MAVSSNTFNADNAMTGFGGTSLGYEAVGQLIGDGTNTYTWDARHHLTQIAQGRTTTASFVYDAFGRRMKKTIGGAVTQFVYDGLNPVQELNGANPPSVTANLLTGLGIDEYFSRTDSSGTTAFLRDALGSTIGLVNSAGAIATSYTYEPFGNTTVNGGNANPYQFIGRENDATGLYYYRARYYSPTFQRFIAQDPIRFGGGDANLYGYVLNRPTDLTDALGLYGTESCGYYSQACTANGGFYECQIAPLACESFPKRGDVTGTSDCVRQCLQEQHKAGMPEPNSCSSENNIGIGSNVSDHASCIAGCVANSQNPYNSSGPALPDEDINLY